MFRDTYVIIYFRAESRRSKKQKRQATSSKFGGILRGKKTLVGNCLITLRDA